MLVNTLLPLLLLPFAAASPVASLEARKNVGDPAAAKKLVAAIATISADVKKLNTTINSFQADSPTNIQTAETIMTETTQLENDLKNAINITEAAVRFNNKQSFSVGVATLNLEPKIKSLLNNIVVHKPAFASVAIVLDLSKTVEQGLETQSGLTAQFGKDLGQKLSKELAGEAPGTTRTILGYFKKAIAAYKSCSGLVCLPPLGGGPP